jgi:hypothetical protein
LYWWDAVAHWSKTNDAVYQPGDAGDYPAIGIDPFGFHVTDIVKDINGKYKYWHVAFFRANDNKATAGIPAAGWHFYDLQSPDGSPTDLIQPVVHHGPTDRAYYVGTPLNDPVKDNVLVFALANPLTANQRIERVTVELVPDDQGHPAGPFIDPVDAPQKGGADIAMSNLYHRVLKAVYRNGLLYFVGNDAYPWFSASELLTSVRLVRLSVGAFPNIPTQNDASYINRKFGKNAPGDGPQDRIYYAWPAVEVNASGNMVIVYARSGIAIFPQVHYSAYYRTEPDIRPSRLLQQGFNAYSGYRWGDTAGASADPEDGGIWVAQQFANASGGWDIWVGEVFGGPRKAPGH